MSIKCTANVTSFHNEIIEKILIDKKMVKHEENQTRNQMLQYSF